MAFRAAWILLALGAAAAAPPDPPVPVDPPHAPGSRFPDLVEGPGGALLMTWIEPAGEGVDALRASRWEAGAERWSPPRTVAEGQGWLVNWADFPSVAMSADGGELAHWRVLDPRSEEAYGIVVARSAGAGPAASAPRSLHDDDSPVEHGFPTLVPEVDGGFLAAWLDGRAYAAGHGRTELRARAVRGDGTLGPEAVVDDRVCDCCATAGAALPDGASLVAYRDRSEEEVRDVAVARYDGRAWSRIPLPMPAGWRIAGCPVNGPAVDAAGERVAVAWFTAGGDRARVEVVFSSDAGRSFGAPVRVREGSLGRVDVDLRPDGSAVVASLEPTGEAGRADLVLTRAWPDGRLTTPLRVATVPATRGTGFPRLAPVDGGTLVAWTEPGEPPRVRAVRVSGP